MVVFSQGILHPQSAEPTSEDDRFGDVTEDLIVPTFPPLAFLIGYVPSELVNNALLLKAYIRSKRFKTIRERFGDLQTVDALYIHALRLTQGNTSLALLYCTVATMDHRTVGLRIPLLRAFLPLTNESSEEFIQRVNNLPKRFYADAPSDGDRDKLQHFFGSAFIAHVFESRGAAERVGTFVEWGEDAFIVDGALDERDLRANGQGREFGLALINATDLNTVLPSHFLGIWIAEKNPKNWPLPQDRVLSRRWSPLRCGVW